jgi:hypothetical protein
MCCVLVVGFILIGRYDYKSCRLEIEKKGEIIGNTAGMSGASKLKKSDKS